MDSLGGLLYWFGFNLYVFLLRVTGSHCHGCTYSGSVIFFFVFSPPFLASDPLSNKYNTRQGTALFRGFSNLCPRGALANRHSKLKTDCLTRRMMNEFVWYSHWYPVSSRWQVVLTKQILEDNDFHTLIGSNTRLLSLGKYSHCRPVSRRSATPGG